MTILIYLPEFISFYSFVIFHAYSTRHSFVTYMFVSSYAPPAAAMDDYTRALRLIVRLQQPPHALLLQREPNGEFKRIAAEHEIVVPGIDRRINFARDIRVGV